MTKVIFKIPNKRTKRVNFEKNLSLMEVAEKHNIEGIKGICNGSLCCSSCHVHISEPAFSKLEKIY